MSRPGGRPRLAMIGCGNIAEFHARAFRAAGFELVAVCGSPGSTRAKAFAATHGIPRVNQTVGELIGMREEWDALLIAVSVEATLETMHDALASEAPMLVEKPVACQSTTLRPFREGYPQVIVGYNRRFYMPVREARLIVRNGSSVVAHLELPESVRDPGHPASMPSYLRPFFANSVHGLDLLRFIFGTLTVEHVSRLMGPLGALQGFAAILTTPRGDVVELTGNWRAPANFRLTIDRGDQRFELRPFEHGTLYEGVEVLEPSRERPIRSYRPKRSGEVTLEDVDYRLKPGFFQQAQALAALTQGQDPGHAARLDDAYEAVVLAEALAGQTYPALGVL